MWDTRYLLENSTLLNQSSTYSGFRRYFIYHNKVAVKFAMKEQLHLFFSVFLFKWHHNLFAYCHQHNTGVTWAELYLLVAYYRGIQCSNTIHLTVTSNRFDWHQITIQHTCLLYALQESSVRRLLSQYRGSKTPEASRRQQISSAK